MALTERRMIKHLQESTIPGREAELLEITSSPIKYEIDRDSLSTGEPALNHAHAYLAVLFLPA
jgi:hypothetical protein